MAGLSQLRARVLVDKQPSISPLSASPAVCLPPQQAVNGCCITPYCFPWSKACLILHTNWLHSIQEEKIPATTSHDMKGTKPALGWRQNHVVCCTMCRLKGVCGAGHKFLTLRISAFLLKVNY